MPPRKKQPATTKQSWLDESPNRVLIDGIPAEEKLKRAKVQLVIQQPFISTILLNLKLEEGSDKQMVCKSMQTDGRSIQWYRPFVDALTVGEALYVLAHEVWHVALGHPLRRSSRQPVKWNIAGDIVINNMLNDCGLQEPSKFNGYSDKKFAQCSTEYVYDHLPDQPEDMLNQLIGAVIDQMGKGEAGEDRQLSDSELTAAEQELKQLVLSAAESQKTKGSTPRCVSSLVDQYKESNVPWNEYIKAKLLYCIGHGKWDMRKPSKRYVRSGIFLPQITSHQMGTVLFIRDTSGSVSDEDLAYANGEIKSICEDLKASVWLVDCDCQVYDRGHGPTGEVDWNTVKQVKGRGGTSFVPPFEWLEQNIEEVKPIAVIYFTDMEGDFPQAKLDPGVPTYWVSTEPLTTHGGNSKFGIELQYEKPTKKVK